MPPPPEGRDPGIWEILQGTDAERDDEFWALAEELRQAMRAGTPGANPEFRTRLRHSLMTAASRERRGRRRPLGLTMGASLGAAGLAMVAVVVASVYWLPQHNPGAVQVVARGIMGNKEVPVDRSIRLNFNQPMAEPSVVRGLKVRPALTYATSWPDAKTLLIRPAHHLAPNVPYLVTIARTDARSLSGGYPISNIVIPFGTQSSSYTAVGQPPSLISTAVAGSATGQVQLQYSPDGQLVLYTTSSLEVNGQAAPTPLNSPTPQPPTTPAASPSPAAPSPALAPTSLPTTGSIYALNASSGGAPQLIASGALGMQVSPDGTQVAYWVPQSNGEYLLQVKPLSGSGGALSLAFSNEPQPTVYWADDGDLMYSDQGTIKEVALDGTISQVDPNIRPDSQGGFKLAPSGQAIFTRVGNSPTVFDLTNGTSTALPATAVGDPVWSPSGNRMAFVAEIGSRQVLTLADTFGGQLSQLLEGGRGQKLDSLAFAANGPYLAFTTSRPGLAPALHLADIATGTTALLDTLRGFFGPVFNPFGSQLSVLQRLPNHGGTTIDSMQLTSSASGTSGPSAPEAAALQAASSLASLQISAAQGSGVSPDAVLQPGLNLPASVLVPGRFDRYYTVSSSPSSPPGSYLVDVRLVRDATVSAPSMYLQEQVTVRVGPGNPEVTAITDGLLTQIPSGPLVVSATEATNASGITSFYLTFNSDIDPTTVSGQSISLVDNNQPVPGLQYSYSPSSRTLTVTAAGLAAGPVLLSVEPPLADVDHELVQPYQLSLSQITGGG